MVRERWLIVIGDRYDRKLVQVSTTSGSLVEGHAYIWNPDLRQQLKLDEEWNYETFRKEHLEWYLENTVRSCRREMEVLGMTNL